MKTIFVTFDTGKYAKRYCFNTDADVKIGDVIDSPNYSNQLTVVEVLNQSYSYFNRATGELLDSINGTNVFPITELKIMGDTEANVVFGKIIDRGSAL